MAQSILFDLEDPSGWMPFLLEDSKIPEPSPFYDSTPIAPKMVKTRVAALQKMIFNEIKAAYMVYRHKNNMETAFMAELQPVLQEGLEILENQKCASCKAVGAVRDELTKVAQEAARAAESDDKFRLTQQAGNLKKENARLNYDAWRGRLVAAVPKGYAFEGIPVSFAYCDAKRIRKWLMEHHPYHMDSDESVKFAIAVHVRPYPNSVNSVYVFVAKLFPRV